MGNRSLFCLFFVALFVTLFPFYSSHGTPFSHSYHNERNGHKESSEYSEYGYNQPSGKEYFIGLETNDGDDLFPALWRKHGESLSNAAKQEFVRTYGTTQSDIRGGYETLRRREKTSGRKDKFDGKFVEGQNEWSLGTHGTASFGADCKVLQDFYAATGGEEGDWIVNTGWNRTDFGTICCEVAAYGVECTTEGRVSHLYEDLEHFI
jgi:hypothetical protein